MARQVNKNLTFLLGNEVYGIPVVKVKEIIGMMPITQAPKMPEFVKGVINLRGKIIPIVDLRLTFGLLGRDYDDRTCIVVVEIAVGGSARLSGLVVDTVSEVLEIGEECVEPPPDCVVGVEQQFLTGMGKVKDKVVMLLNVDQVLDDQEKASLPA